MMVPNPFSIDSQSNSTDLATGILSATSLPQISAAISAVESHLSNHSFDQNRHFFSTAFPALICRIFGFDDSTTSGGWIESVSAANDTELSGKIFNLLSPKGVLMNSVFDIDRLGLVEFVFPSERLPELIRLVNSAECDRDFVSELCPMLKGRVKRDQSNGKLLFQVQLNVFEYYVFWFAYYPTCKRNSENLGLVSALKTRKSALENWTSSLPFFSVSTGRGSEQKNDCNLYTRLLYAYLSAFVPMSDSSAHQTFSSSLLHYYKDADDSIVSRAEFFVNALAHYWLAGNDTSPLSVRVRKSISLAVPFRPMLSDVPPVSGLGELISLFVNYLNLCSTGVTEERRPSTIMDGVKSLEATLVSTSLPSARPWNLRVQRPLYRFILRTFLSCPIGSSMKDIFGVVSIWIGYMEPWKLSKDRFLELDSMEGSFVKHHGQSKDLKYTSIWQDYVLSNYIYYTRLVMHFIGFAHKFLHTDPEMVVQMVAKVINVLTCSRDVIDLIKNVDTMLNSRQAGSFSSTFHTMFKSVMPIHEQLMDWEDGLYDSGVNGSFSHDDSNKDSRLFSDGENGGLQLLQLFVLRAETELQAVSANQSSLASISSLKSQLCCLFGDHALNSSPNTPKTIPCQQSREEIFMPRRGAGNYTQDGPKYKGDWMKRPVSDNEVAWLAQLLIHLSSWLNEVLGLNQSICLHENPTWSYVDDTQGDQLDDEHESGDAVKVKLMILRFAMVRLMIKHGMKVNLRVFASKKFIMLLLLLSLCHMLKKSFRLAA